MEILSEGHNDPLSKKSESQTDKTGGHNIQVAISHSEPFLLKKKKLNPLPQIFSHSLAKLAVMQNL